MNLETCYEKLHGSYSDAVSRLMNDALITKFILKFPADPTMDQLREAVAAGDIEGSFRAAHTMKGVAANLAFTGLAQASSALTEQLRPCTQPADIALYEAVCAEYQTVIEVLEELKAQA